MKTKNNITYCKYCGTKLHNGRIMCSHCAEKLKAWRELKALLNYIEKLAGRK